jgi:hypothetical protein
MEEIWGDVCQVGSGDHGASPFLLWVDVWFGVRVAAGRRGRFRLICEGWLPHDGAALCRAAV